MHSVNSLRTTLGLTSANQVRNRIEAIKDLLLPHIRRGPNNQILLTDDGADLLRRLQELHDSGLTMTEASSIVRASIHKEIDSTIPVSRTRAQNGTKPDGTAALLTAMREELAVLRRQIASLERRLSPRSEPDSAASWWSSLREEIDAP